MKTIVWDMDDVLNHFTSQWLAMEWNAKHGTGHRFSELRTKPPGEPLGIPLDQYLESIDRFEAEVGSALSPRWDVMSWFGANGHRSHNIVLTARPVASMATAANWVFSHFGQWIRGFYCVPSQRPDDVSPRFDTGKAAVLCRLGQVDFFIDDDRGNVEAACEMGIRGLLFPQPWNPGAPAVETLLAELERAQ